MSQIHSVLLESYFFEYIDRDIPLRATPLMTGVFEEEALSEHIAGRFGLTPEEAEDAIEMARQEVEL